MHTHNAGSLLHSPFPRGRINVITGYMGLTKWGYCIYPYMYLYTYTLHFCSRFGVQTHSQLFYVLHPQPSTLNLSIRDGWMGGKCLMRE
jgi:hypothetical protein